MLGITHALIGIALCKFFHLGNNIFELALAGLFAVLPDIDHPSSFFGTLLRPLSIKLYSKFGHRDLTHSLIFMNCCIGPMLFTPYFMLAFVAMASHLAADMLTYTGIPLFLPYRKNFTILGGMVKTGSWHEILVIIVSLGVIILC